MLAKPKSGFDTPAPTISRLRIMEGAETPGWLPRVRALGFVSSASVPPGPLASQKCVRAFRRNE